MKHHSTGLYTLCFLKRADSILLLKRANPPDAGFYNGVGGKIERSETVEEGLIREVIEETGFTLLEFELKGILRFVDQVKNKDYLIFTYFSDQFEGEMISKCPEGELLWVERSKIFDWPLVPNIPIFLPHLEETTTPLSFHFYYPDGERKFTYRYEKNGQKIEGTWPETYFSKAR